MMEGYVFRHLERMTPVLLGLFFGLAMLQWTQGRGLAASGDATTEQGVQWYDPLEWFNEGGNLPHESQWYHDTYGREQARSAQGARPYYAPMEEMPAGNPQTEQFEGEILQVRTAWFRKAPLQVFARVRLDSGAVTAVDLGPRSQLNFLDLGALKGKRISVVAHPATIAGKKALVAHEVRLYGITTRIYWSLPKA